MGGAASTEQGDWSQDVVSQLTPSVSRFAEQTVKGNIEPAVRKSLKGGDEGKGHKPLGDFRFTSMDFGSVPPKVTNVKTHKAKEDGDGQGKSVVVDFDLDYQGDCNLQVSMMGIHSGVRDLHLCGRARAVLKPTTSSSPPFFGGIQFCFLDDVKIDFDFEGVANICDWPIVRKKMRKAIVKEVAAKCVYPNKVIIPTSSVNPMQVKCFDAKAVLGVRVVSGSSLPKKDGLRSLVGQAKPDAYVISKFGSTSHESSVVKNNTDPVWNSEEWFDFLVEHPNGHAIKFLVYDHDTLSKDDFLGRAMVDIGEREDELAAAGSDGMEVTLALQDDPRENKKKIEITGQLTVKARMLLLAPLSELGSDPRIAVVTLFVYSCNNLVEMADGTPLVGDDEGLPGDVVVQATVGNLPMQETPAIEGTYHPSFEHGFTFVLRDMSDWNNTTASLVTLDKTKGARFGQLDLNLGEIAKKPMKKAKVFSLSQERPMITITVAANMKFA